MKKIIPFFEFFNRHYGYLLRENAEQVIGLLKGKYGFSDDEIDVIRATLPQGNEDAAISFITKTITPFLRKHNKNLAKAKVDYIKFLQEDGEDIKKYLERFFLYKDRTSVIDYIVGLSPDAPELKQENTLTSITPEDITGLHSINMKDLNTYKGNLKLLNTFVLLGDYITNTRQAQGRGAESEKVKSLQEVKGKLKHILTTSVRGNEYEVWQFMSPDSAQKLLRNESNYVIPGAENNAWCLKDPSYFVRYGKNPKYKSADSNKYPNDAYENFIVLRNGKAYIVFDFESMSAQDIGDRDISDNVAQELAPVLKDFIIDKYNEYYGVNLQEYLK